MKLSFRWYGSEDKVSLAEIKQIPGMVGIVSAIYDLPAGEVWPKEKVVKLKQEVESHGLELAAIESVPVPEEIKLGGENRDKYIKNFQQTIENIAAAGINVVCYNFMPVFDWLRSDLNHELTDGSTTLSYDESVIQSIDPREEEFNLPGWDTSYDHQELQRLLNCYQQLTAEDIWANLEYFLQQVIPTAEKAGVKLAIHPADPPWSIFGLPRLMTNKKNLERVVNLVDSPSNGLAICTGSLGANPANNLPEIIRYFGRQDKIHFAHLRNIKITGEKCFQETAHRSEAGLLDMYEILKAYHDVGYNGPLRPDHGRMIWGETGKPGYGLYDRALGATYLNGIWEALDKTVN